MLLILLNAASAVDFGQVAEKLLNWGMETGKNILAAIVIYIVGRFIIRQIMKLVSKILVKRDFEVSVQTFLKSLLSILLNLVLAFAIISKLGVETTSLAALLASAGVAIGMALSGNLSNFAGGLVILVFKPFKVGDFIDTTNNEVSGTVKEIQIFHTILTTVDNRLIYVPNGTLSSNAIVNYSRQEMRRAEWVFGVEYGMDFERVKAVIDRLIAADSRILKEPAPMVALSSLSASSVDIKVRAWTKVADYWDVYFDFNKAVYETFNKEGIGFPFLRKNFAEGKKIRMIAVEPESCPKLTRGQFQYDFGDVAGYTPLLPMFTLGHNFAPANIHAGGLRYHGAGVIVSQLLKDGLMEAVDIQQLESFDAGCLFARVEGIIPAPESCHAIAATIREARRCKETGEAKVILFNLSGHGLIDMASYDKYLAGDLVNYELSDAEIQRNLDEIDG